MQRMAWLLIAWLGVASWAAAGNGRAFCWRPRSYDYLPATNHYVIVKPTETVSAHHGNAPRPCTWPLERISANPYPYGWFGARPTPQSMRSGSYYGDYLQYQSNPSP